MALYEPRTYGTGTSGDHPGTSGDHPGPLVSGPAGETAETAVEAAPSRSRLQVLATATLTAGRRSAAGTWRAAQGAWTVGGWLVHGVRGTSVLAYRYVRAHDYLEDIGGKSSKKDAQDVKAERRARWKTIVFTAAGAAVADRMAWRAMVDWAHVPAHSPAAWATAPAIEGLAVLAGLAAYGRYRLEQRVPAGQLLAPEDVDDPEEYDPYPLAYCDSAARAEDCLARAMYAEGLGAHHVSVSRRFSWGWEIDVLLRNTTAAKVAGAVEALEAHMNLPRGGFTMETDPAASARIVVRAATSDPFADMPRPRIHAPNSLSVHDLVDMGRGLDGQPLQITLDGFFALVIGAMGAGKTLGALRTLAEAITACVDAVAWDLDPVKDGLSEFGPLMEHRGRGPAECEELLARGLEYVRGRAGIFRSQLGMGDRWKASRTHPAIYIFVDEVKSLTAKAKQDLVEILRTGRQLGVWLIVSGQDATEDSLGDAIAGLVAYRIMLACRPEDTRIGFGPGRAALGWLPHRLVAATAKLANDAGKSFIMGGPFARPIPWLWHYFGIEQIATCVPERVAAGRPRTDADTRRAAGEDVTDDGRPMTLADRLERSGRPDAGVLAELLRAFDDRDAEWLPSALLLARVDGHTTADGRPMDADRMGRIIRAHAPEAASVRQAWDGQPQVRGWLRRDVEQAARGLLEPTTARLGGD